MIVRFILYFLDLATGLFMEKKNSYTKFRMKGWNSGEKTQKIEKIKSCKLYTALLWVLEQVNRVVLNCYYTYNFISKNKEWNTKYIKQCPTRCIMNLDPLESTEILKDNDISKVKITRCSNQPCEKWNKH